MSVRKSVGELRQKGLNQSEISRLVGVSRERVRQIITGSNAQREPSEETDLPLSTGEVARLLNVHTNTVRRWSSIGLIKTYRLGPRGDRRFMRDDVLKMLKK